MKRIVICSCCVRIMIVGLGVFIFLHVVACRYARIVCSVALRSSAKKLVSLMTRKQLPPFFAPNTTHTSRRLTHDHCCIKPAIRLYASTVMNVCIIACVNNARMYAAVVHTFVCTFVCCNTQCVTICIVSSRCCF